MFIPKALVLGMLAVVMLLVGWTTAVLLGRNPLPFPDRGYQVFTASSPAAMDALAELLRSHGNAPRFRVDSDGVQRAIFWDGTIVNYPTPAVLEQLGGPAAAIGFVARDPAASALHAARLLRERGFSAMVHEGVEPGLPITFVTTDALAGSVLVFRRHQLKMGQRPQRWTAAADASTGRTR
jgi:hypothetical protein